VRLLCGSDSSPARLPETVRVLRGLGMGLDENAIQAIRNWRFIPAKDAAQRPFRGLDQVETVYRFFRIAPA
jgi:outer membrane biosynthesis protein TonB